MKTAIGFISLTGLALVLALSANGAMMGNAMMGSATDDHTAAEEAEGKALWEKLQTKQTSCADLTDDDFASIGEYFMGLMLGESHAAMNAMITRAHGEEGEEAMHAVMGKRISGCDPNATFGTGSGFGPMMMSWGTPTDGGTMGFFDSTYGTRSMMGGRFHNAFSPIVFIWWALAIAGVVFFFRWLLGKDRRGGSALGLLEERLAKGEISKEQFAELRKIIQS